MTLSQRITMGKSKHVALVAHDGKKKELLEWVTVNKESLSRHTLYGTGTTARLVQERTGLLVIPYKSGPLGGDLQIGADIATGKINCLIFLWDPLESQPHDPDIKALLRIATVYNIPIANNLATADFILQSQLMDSEYSAVTEGEDTYLNERLTFFIEER